MSYNPRKPAELDGETFNPISPNRRRVDGRMPDNRPVNAGALAALNRALYELANPLPPVSRYFKFRRWMRAKRSAMGIWYRWKLDRWRCFRLGMGLRVGSWIAGEDIR